MCARLCFLHTGTPEVEKECAHIYGKSVPLIPLSFLPPIYSSIHPVLYLFYTLVPNANRSVCSPLNSGSNTRPRMCRFVCEKERKSESESARVSNRAQVLICHQRAAALSLCCQSSRPGDKHSASNTQSHRTAVHERWRREGRNRGRGGEGGATGQGGGEWMGGVSAGRKSEGQKDGHRDKSAWKRAGGGEVLTDG